jgi:hypothetical protein
MQSDLYPLYVEAQESDSALLKKLFTTITFYKEGSTEGDEGTFTRKCSVMTLTMLHRKLWEGLYSASWKQDELSFGYPSYLTKESAICVIDQLHKKAPPHHQVPGVLSDCSYCYHDLTTLRQLKWLDFWIESEIKMICVFDSIVSRGFQHDRHRGASQKIYRLVHKKETTYSDPKMKFKTCLKDEITKMDPAEKVELCDHLIISKEFYVLSDCLKYFADDVDFICETFKTRLFELFFEHKQRIRLQRVLDRFWALMKLFMKIEMYSKVAQGGDHREFREYLIYHKISDSLFGDRMKIIFTESVFRKLGIEAKYIKGICDARCTTDTSPIRTKRGRSTDTRTDVEPQCQPSRYQCSRYQPSRYQCSIRTSSRLCSCRKCGEPFESQQLLHTHLRATSHWA